MAGMGPARSSCSASSSIFFCESDSDERASYFLDSCSLCKTPLHLGDEIYMYRGDVPFCSEECRQRQIDLDEEKEKSRAKMRKANKFIVNKAEIKARAADSAIAV